MKYSIKGNLKIEDEGKVVELLNSYKLWRLITGKHIDSITGENMFEFEVWLNSESDKDDLFNDLKPIVDMYGEYINWHECTHDELVSQPCMIAEEYRSV